jgi:acetate kinase
MKSPNSELSLILTINAGSSSIKFAGYRRAAVPQIQFSGRIERIGLDHASFELRKADGATEEQTGIQRLDYKAAGDLLIERLDRAIPVGALAAVGHRVVHGGNHSQAAEKITPDLLLELHYISVLDPQHMPFELQLIEAFSNRDPSLLQIACFDTAFHHNMPRVARILPIPRKFEARGVRRYGFHGLSYAYLLQELARENPVRGRIVLAHLGSGASLCAVRDGQCMDTSMSFTPTAGIPMATRSGDLDPGLVDYMARTERMSAEQFHAMVNQQSGLLGVSEISPDMRDLLKVEATDIRAAEAVQLFCYQTRKYVGAYAAALGGLDAIVFSGGIGENSPPIRARICEGLEFLDLHLDPTRNLQNDRIISTDASRVKAFVIPTDEESMIARYTEKAISNLKQA